MNRFVPALAALAMVGLAAAAHAETADGDITGIDHEMMTVTLDSGGPYHVMESGMLNELKTGDRATVTYEEKDGKMVASQIIHETK